MAPDEVASSRSRSPDASLLELAGSWSKYSVVSTLLAVGLTCVPAGVMWVAGLWWGSVVLAVYAVLSGLVGVAMWRGAPMLTTFWLHHGATAVMLFLITLGERPVDPLNLAFCLILPMSGLLMSGWRGGVTSLGLALLTVAAAVATEALGIDPIERHGVPGWVSNFRLLTLLSTVSSMTVLSEWLRRQAAMRADAATQARSLFLANMSHELRTPMNGVIGLADLLLHSDPRADQREHLELVRRSGEHMVTLINDLIDLTRLESGRLVVEAIPVQLAPLVHDTVALNRPSAWNKGLEVEVAIADGTPEWVVTDGVRLKQVLMNLVGNAVKFTEKGTVRVTLEASAGRLRLQVSDTGVGMSPEVLSRMFRPFEQADSSFTRRYGGSGLGLAISHQLVRAMNGGIDVQSTVGQGSRFTVDIPAPAAAPPGVLGIPSPAPSPPASIKARGQQLILVVEDNAVNLRVAVGLLHKAGFATDTARNGHEALKAVQARPYDAILMDCHMPEMDGFEATRLIRALGGKASETPILALTASALKEDLDRCTSVGMNACVTKPVSLKSLTRALEQLTHPQVS